MATVKAKKRTSRPKTGNLVTTVSLPPDLTAWLKTLPHGQQSKTIERGLRLVLAEIVANPA